MKAHILLFASLRERFKKDHIDMEVPHGTRAWEILKILCGNSDEARKLARSTMFAINEEYVSPETEISDGDELALIPPVAGG